MAEATDKPTRVLFVDDDKAYLEVLSALCSELSQGAWQVFTAENAGHALNLLQDQGVELVVLDLKMPVVDGLQFLALLHRKHPSLLKAVLTGFGGEQQRTACLNAGADLFLEKPRDRQGLTTLFSVLNELVTVQHAQGFRGVLRQAGLPEVIQMECLSRHSVRLEVTAAVGRGEIIIFDGEIIHAQFGELVGEPAFNKILALKGGAFNLLAYEEPPRRTIESQWEFLLMEAARRRDEASVSPESLPEAAVQAPASGWDAYVPRDLAAEAAPQSYEPSLLPPRIEELLICSDQGDVLYEWQCPSAETRITFLEFLAQKSAQLAAGLPLGDFGRIEVTADHSRMVAQVQSERRILVRSIRES